MTDHLRHRRPYANVLETIAWTPLIRLTRVAQGIRTPVYGKAEFFNPGGSVKDRIGLPMIEAFGITSFFAPPTVRIALLRSPLFDPAKLSRLAKGY